MEHPKYAFFEGQIVPFGEAKVGVLTHALNYGTAVFGGIRGYWNDQQQRLYIFRPIDHYQRFIQSTRLLSMELEYSPERLCELTLELLRKERYQRDIYIRPLAYKADELIGVRLHNLRDALSIVALPFDRYMKNDDHAHVTVSSWRRVDDNMIPARGKISGAYVNSSLIKTDAYRSGFDEAIVLNQDGHISEGSAMNVFIVRNGTMITPAITDNILEGITRRSIIELAREELKIPVVERPIDRSELYICDELFLTGTAAQVTAVTRVDHRPIGNGEMGPVTASLRELYAGIVRAQNPKYMHWTVLV